MVNLTPSCEAVGWQFQANEKGIPLTRHSRLSKLQFLGDNELEFETGGMSLAVEVIARGDFNGNGLNDLVVRVSGDATEGTWGATRQFLLSRSALALYCES
jgi:hypothetical protein